MPKRTETLVVGAGPVGLFTALSLAQRGLGVRICDGQWRKAALSYALALHPSSLELLAELGLAGDLVAEGYRVDRVAFYEGTERRAVVSYDKLASPWPFLLILPQSTIEGALEGALADRGVEVEWNHLVADIEPRGSGVRATVERREKVSSGYAAAGTDWVIDRIFDLDADFVIGADGNRSTVRRRLAIPFEELAPPRFYAVFEFETPWDAAGEVRILLGPDGGEDVLWPLPGGRCRFGFEVGPDSASFGERTKSRLIVQVAGQGYPHLPEDDLSCFLAERAPWFDAEVRKIHWSLAVRFETRLARNFGMGHAWLAGDAGHLAGPIAVASMNVGFKEGHDLARRIHEVLRGGLPLARLEEYGMERTAEWSRLVAPDGGLAAGAGADEFVRNHAGRVAALLPASGSHRLELAEALGLGAAK